MRVGNEKDTKWYPLVAWNEESNLILLMHYTASDERLRVLLRREIHKQTSNLLYTLFLIPHTVLIFSFSYSYNSGDRGAQS